MTHHPLRAALLGLALLLTAAPARTQTPPKGNDLAPALKRAVDIVKRGEPVLVDVVTQPR